MHSMNAFVIQRSARRPWNLLLTNLTRRIVTHHRMKMYLLYIKLSSRYHPMNMTRGTDQSLQSLSQMPFGCHPVWTLQNFTSSTFLRPRQLDPPRHANEFKTRRVCLRTPRFSNKSYCFRGASVQKQPWHLPGLSRLYWRDVRESYVTKVGFVPRKTRDTWTLSFVLLINKLATGQTVSKHRSNQIKKLPASSTWNVRGVGPHT